MAIFQRIESCQSTVKQSYIKKYQMCNVSINQLNPATFYWSAATKLRKSGHMYVIGVNFESTIFTTAWYFLLHFINTHSNMKLTFNTCSDIYVTILHNNNIESKKYWPFGSTWSHLVSFLLWELLSFDCVFDLRLLFGEDFYCILTILSDV
jgi:hypothetical protein